VSYKPRQNTNKTVAVGRVPSAEWMRETRTDVFAYKFQMNGLQQPRRHKR